MGDIIKPEIESRLDLRWYGRHMAAILENLHNVITLSVIIPFG